MTRGEFSPATKRLIRARDNNRCVLCGIYVGEGGEVHHRRPRKHGGSRHWTTSSPANGLLLCHVFGGNGCHQHIEANRKWAYDHGFLIHEGPARNPTDPASVAVVVDVRVGWWLGHDGSRRPARVDERTI